MITVPVADSWLNLIDLSKELHSVAPSLNELNLSILV